MRGILSAALLCATPIALAGCAAGNPWILVFVVSVGLAALGMSGCGTSHTGDGDAAMVEDGSSEPDAGEEGGSWDPCCADGVIDTCYCPPDTACNYAWFTDCGGGMCTFEESCTGDPDAGVDAGADGTWETCCVEGRVDTCFCPAGLACNYGWFTDCGAGACVGPGDMCPTPPPADAGPADAGPGTWDPCCVDGRITTCFCPAGAICNYFYSDCGDGVTCAAPGETCPAP